MTGPRLHPAVGWTVLTLLLGVVCLPGAQAAFTATTSSAGDTWSAAAGFPDYPTAVVADHPSAYYRLEDAPGSLLAADSSGNGATGVYGTSTVGLWAGLWALDDGSGATAADLSGAAVPHSLTLSGATWTGSGRSGPALAFNGTSAYAATSSSVLTTSASFTVSAWVYLTDTSVSRTVLGQSGVAVDAFELGYDAGRDRWTFEMPRSDSAGASVDVVASSSAPSLNTWTQLTATFNTVNNGMDLYVNGVQQTAVTFGGTPWNAGGALEVGAGRTTLRTRFWEGRIDSVRVAAVRAPSSASVELTLGANGEPPTSWPFDENSGSTATDAGGGLVTGTLGSSASWGGAKVGTSSVDLPGDADGYVAGDTAAVDTSAGFTVSAWVYLDHTALGTMSRVAVSQSAYTKSGFMLRYNHYGQQWEFAVTRGPTDDSSPVYDSSYSANGSVALTTWTHLVGVYDAGGQTVRLYVNGVAQASTAHTSTFSATGPLQVGRVKEFGAWQVGAPGLEAWGPWAGQVDEVRVFRRALDAAEVSALSGVASATGTAVGVPGALQGPQQGQTSSTAQAFSRSARASFDSVSLTNPTTYSLECWFRTTGVPGATRGQTLIAFSIAPSGNTATHDRRLLLDVSGHLVAGTSSSASGAVSPGTYTDGAWHHVVATVSPSDGIRLYADGALVATAAYTAPGNFTGYWRWGGDTWDATWPADYYWVGQLDEVAFYPTELAASRVAVHYHANH